MNKSLFVGIIVLIIIGVVGVIVIRSQGLKRNTPEQPAQESQQPVSQPSTETGSEENQRPGTNEALFPNDKDHDGIEDEREKELGTSDEAFDTDKDGISDQLEINEWKTDPTNADTDGDGFSDGIEILQGYNPLGEGRVSR